MPALRQRLFRRRISLDLQRRTMGVLNLRSHARLNSRCGPRRKLNRRSGLLLPNHDLKLAQHSRCDQSHVLRPRLVLKIVPSRLPTLRLHRGLRLNRPWPRPSRMSVLTRMSTRNRSKRD